MKKIRMTIVSVLLTMASGTALAENVVTANDVFIMRGKTAELTIGVENDMNISSVDFLLYLPDGVSAVWDDELEDYAWDWCERVPGNSRESFFSMYMNKAADGGLFVGISSPKRKILNGNSGPVFTLTLFAEKDAKEDIGWLKQIALGDETGEGGEEHSVHPDDVMFTVGMTDGVSTVSASCDDSNRIYNLAGQRLDKQQKGVNITNGKKVLVK